MAVPEREIEVGGVRLVVVRKRMRTIRFRVASPDGAVRVSAPLRLSERALREVVARRLDWIAAARRKLAARPAVEARPPRVFSAADRRALRARADPLLDAWAARMGVPRPWLGIRAMRTLWGSCNPRAGRVWLNLALVHASEAALEHVVVHELAHLIERGHGRAFVAILDGHLPDWRAARGELRGMALGR